MVSVGCKGQWPIELSTNSFKYTQVALALAKKEPPDKMQGGARKVQQPDGWSLFWNEKVQWPIELSNNIFRCTLVALHSTQLSRWVNLTFELA